MSFSGSDDGSDHWSSLQSEVSEYFNEWFELQVVGGEIEVQSHGPGGDDDEVRLLLSTVDDDEEDDFAVSQYLRVPNNSPNISVDVDGIWIVHLSINP